MIQADDTRPGCGNRVGERVRGERDLSRGIGRTEDEELVTCSPPPPADVGDRLLAATAVRGDGVGLQVVEHPEDRPENRSATRAAGRGLGPLAIAPGAPKLHPGGGQRRGSSDGGATECEQDCGPCRQGARIRRIRTRVKLRAGRARSTRAPRPRARSGPRGPADVHALLEELEADRTDERAGPEGEHEPDQPRRPRPRQASSMPSTSDEAATTPQPNAVAIRPTLLGGAAIQARRFDGLNSEVSE
jgi:hypothetical protein